MADLRTLQQFAADHGFGLTAPLTHAQVVRLAEYWLPEMRFHWDERFHPVTLDDIFAMVEDALRRAAAGGAGRSGGWRSSSAPGDERRDPGVRPAGRPRPRRTVPVPGPQGGTQFRKVVRVLNEGTPGARRTAGCPRSATDAIVTHGASFGRSNQFFGPLTTLSAATTPRSAGDPFMPRADEPDPEHTGERRPRITVMAALLNLLDLLEYELTVAEEDAGRLRLPARRAARRFDIVANLLAPRDPRSRPRFRRESSASSCSR